MTAMQPVKEEYQKQWSMDYQPGGYRQENGLFFNLSLFRYIVSIHKSSSGWQVSLNKVRLRSKDGL